MVPVVVYAPLHGGDGSRGVGGHGGGAPEGAGGSVVVDADARVVPAWPAPSDLGSGYVGPGGDGLEDGAFGAGVYPGLEKGMPVSALPGIGKTKDVTSDPRRVRLAGTVRYPCA